MGKKRVLSLVLMMMIVICCITEAVVIGELKGQNDQMEQQIEELDSRITGTLSEVENVNSKLDEQEQAELPDLYLPSDIYVCSGLTMEIYDNCVSSGSNLDNYDFYWECEVGDCMEDKFRIHAGEEDVGEYPLTLHIYNLRAEEVECVEATLHVVPNVFAQEDTGSISMLTIGDSLSASTDWFSYTRALSQDKLFHVGTLGDTEGLRNEGRPGITAADYLAGNLYGVKTDSPFINPQTEEFDWAYYKQNTGINPDVVQVFLGTNGLALDPTDNVADIVGIVDKIREADSDIQILVVLPIYPANQDGMASQQNIAGYESLHGMWALSRKRMVFNLISALEQELGDENNVTLVPAAVMFDTENGFDQTLISKNPHSDVQETVPAQGIHPSAAGYDQIGDSIYSTLCYLIDQKKLTTTHGEETGE